jgi:hypothetical protein
MTNEEQTMQLVLENFDVDSFLNTQYEVATEFKRTLIPAGYVELRIEEIEIIKPKRYQDKKTGEMKWTSPVLRLKCPVADEGIRTLLNVTDPTRVLYAYPQIYMDVNSTGMIDMGPNKNLLLGQLRRALGQNEDGTGWRLPDLANMSPFWAECKHDQPDPNDELRVFERWQNFVANPGQIQAAA